MFIDTGEVTSPWGKEITLTKSREETKIEHRKEEWNKLIPQG